MHIHLLLVEDNLDLATTVIEYLEISNIVCDHASNGQTGLNLALAQHYDVILLDIMLPRLDGWQVLERLRKTKKTPVVFLTARDTLADRVRGLDGGGDDYLVKPFDLTELFARLRAVIRRSANRPSPEIVLGNVVIDTRARTVTADRKHVPLTAREYTILEYLAQHQGKVVSRTELYEHVFDEREDTMSNLLDVHVYNIRRKLARDLIATRRGQGYCIGG